MNGSRHLLRIDDTDLHWVELGQGRPLVLLHGLCDSLRTWSRAAEHLARTRRVIMLDLPGHGLSSRPDASYELGWYASVIAHWIDACGFEDVDVAGHSFGGGVAQMLLVERRERVRRLALVASGGLGREVSLGLRLLSTTRAAERFGQPIMAISTRIGMASEPAAFGDDDLAWQSWANGMPGSSRALSRTVRDVIDWRGQRRHFWDRAHELGALPPVSIFWGSRDPVIPIAHGERAHSMLEGATFTRFEQCGHFPHREQPEAFARALEAFLAADALPRARIRGALAVVPRRRGGWFRRLWAALKGRFRRTAPLREGRAALEQESVAR